MTTTPMTHAAEKLRLPLLLLVALVALASCRTEIAVPKDPPEARKDYAQTALNTPVTLDPAANDHDPTGEAITAIAIGVATNGTAVLNPNGTVTYTPNGGYLGGDEFTVTVSDASGHEATESAYITVGPSSRFLYLSNFVDYFTKQLYLSDSVHPGVAIPVSGWIPVTVGSFQPFASINAYIQSADGQHVVYTADEDDQRTESTINLFYVNMDRPGAPIRLTDLVDGRDVLNILGISPDGLYVYYMSNEYNPDAFEIVRVEVANPANKVRMNPALTSTVIGTATVFQSIVRFAVSPDGNYLLYVVFDPTLSTNGARELRRIDVSTPGVSVKVNGPLVGTDGGVIDSSLVGLGFKFLPGSTSQLVYPSLENGSPTVDLYLVDYVTLSAPIKVSGTALTGGVASFTISPDATRIAYSSAENTANFNEIYGVALANPGVSSRLSKPRTGGEPQQGYLIGGDSSYIVYKRDDDTPKVTELYRVDFNNPTVQIKINHALRPTIAGGTHPHVDFVPAEEVNVIQNSPGVGRYVLYSTNNVSIKGYTRQQYYLVSVDAPGIETEIGSPTGAQYYALWSNGGDAITLFDDEEQHNAVSAFLTRVSTPTMMLKLTPERFPGASVSVDYNYAFLP